MVAPDVVMVSEVIVQLPANAWLVKPSEALAPGVNEPLIEVNPHVDLGNGNTAGRL